MNWLLLILFVGEHPTHMTLKYKTEADCFNAGVRVLNNLEHRARVACVPVPKS